MDNSIRLTNQRNRIAITLTWPIPDMGWPAGTVLNIIPEWTPPAPAWVAWKRKGDSNIRLAPASLPPGAEWYVYGGLALTISYDHGGTK